ncbi:hypothetical protein ANAPH2_00655 [Anaplasma phagocytophilum]|nr:hypothetical protein ANAPH2_00655 [Anaplasma phagocytophilum]
MVSVSEDMGILGSTALISFREIGNNNIFKQTRVDRTFFLFRHMFYIM